MVKSIESEVPEQFRETLLKYLITRLESYLDENEKKPIKDFDKSQVEKNIITPRIEAKIIAKNAIAIFDKLSPKVT